MLKAVIGSAGSYSADHVEHPGGVFDGADDRPHLVLGEADWNDAVSAYEATGRTYPHQALSRGRRSDRLPGVAPSPQRAEVSGDSGARPPTGSARGTAEVVGIPGLPA